MPDETAPQLPVTPTQGVGETVQPPLNPADQLMVDAAQTARNIVDAALATPEGQTAQVAASGDEVSFPASSVAGLSAITNREDPTREQPNYSAAMSAYKAEHATATEAAAPATDPNMITGVPAEFGGTAPSVEKTTEQIASEISAAAEQVGLPPTAPVTEATTSEAPHSSYKDLLNSGSSTQSSLVAGSLGLGVPGSVETTPVASATTTVSESSPVATPWPAPEASASPVEVAPPAPVAHPEGATSSTPGNPVLEAELNQLYGDPADKTTSDAAVRPAAPAPRPTPAETINDQLAQHDAGATWPEIQTPAAGAAVNPMERGETTVPPASPKTEMLTPTESTTTTTPETTTTTTSPATEVMTPSTTTTTTTPGETTTPLIRPSTTESPGISTLPREVPPTTPTT